MRRDSRNARILPEEGGARLTGDDVREWISLRKKDRKWNEGTEIAGPGFYRSFKLRSWSHPLIQIEAVGGGDSIKRGPKRQGCVRRDARAIRLKDPVPMTRPEENYGNLNQVKEEERRGSKFCLPAMEH